MNKETKFTPADKMKAEIEDTLYSTGRFTTDECESLGEIIRTVPMIAAAPEMYEALEALEERLNKQLDEYESDAVITDEEAEFILKVISKARGETNNQPTG